MMSFDSESPVKGFEELTEVVPWGRSLEEYTQFFELTPGDLERRILDCGAGPASFTAEVTARGGSVTAVDPIYRFSAADIERRVHEVYPIMLRGMELERDRFVWTHAGSPEQVGERRLHAMRRFLDDLAPGLQAGRYQAVGLPELPFADDSFDLALSSHFLFLYSDQLSVEFHVGAITELLRVAPEMRIFPLLAMDGSVSPHLQVVIDEVRREGHEAEVRPIAFEFQKGGNRLLQVRRGALA